ncbi:MAG: sugar ABC transporter permease [Ruminiclostridium sp.]|nr:sugar ABC transporter permease [Ruminiclostridium sp.]
MWSTLKKYKMLYLMLLPGMLFFIIFSYLPMYGIVIAFQDYKPAYGLQGMINNPVWVGLEHFKDFFSSYYFARILGNTVIIFFLKMLIGFPAPIILALMLNELKNRVYKKAVQTITYMPHFLSMVIVTSIVVLLLNPSNGIINQIIMKLGKDPVYFLADTRYIRSILVIMGTWMGIGWGSILYLAAFAGINPELYENAQIEGAGKFQQVIYITLPSISFIISITLILSMGSILSYGYEDILLLYSPPVYEKVDIIDTFIYREGLLVSRYSYGAAVGFFRNAIGLIMVILTNFLAKKFGNQGIW